jgi:hypothetical protein
VLPSPAGLRYPAGDGATPARSALSSAPEVYTMRHGPVLTLLLSALLLGCPPETKPDDSGADPSDDVDGDGWTLDEGDCDDADPEVNPGAADWVGDDVDSDCDGIDGQDADGDGWASAQSGGDDCDDSNPYVFPGATEGWYDGVDQDCDGGSDYDQDGDGFDAEAHGGGDCDDTDPARSPDVDELCNGIDDDCDGFTDEEDAIDPATFYADADGDGWGVEGVTARACEAPSGYVTQAGDCDDSAPLVHPSAPEFCNGIDDDCDGDFDEDALDAPSWYGDADGDGHGDPATAVASCDPIEGRIEAGEDCDDGNPSIHPGADEWCDGVDTDCDGDLDEDHALDATTWYMDGDRDGYGDPTITQVDCDPVPRHVADNSDCDDADGSIHPDAYDLPDDGIDADCDGADRTFDGVVLGLGEIATSDQEADLGGVVSGYDLAVLFDTTGSMGSALSTLDLTSIDAALVTSLGTVEWGFATFDDYACCGYGTSSGGDRPFILQQQVTDDLALADSVVAATGTHSGADSAESSMEALYQSLTGAGYDQDCDGTFTTSADVLPFLADPGDPFGGTGGESRDASGTGGGLLGGMGFRNGAVPVIAYVTDNLMRDPDAGYGTPGGCPLDAGSDDVVAAALDLGAWLVAVQIGSYSSSVTTQMADLADRTGSLADLDGDGTPDDLVIQIASASSVNASIAHAVSAIDVEVVAALSFDEVWLEVADDPYGMVTGISPASYTSVTSSDWPLRFTISWEGTLPPTTSAQQVTVTFDLYGDGDVLDTLEVVAEVPPI